MYREDYYTRGYGQYTGQSASDKNFWYQTLYDVVWGQSPNLRENYHSSLDAFTDNF